MEYEAEEMRRFSLLAIELANKIYLSSQGEGGEEQLVTAE
jgi:hypothetical protein